MTNTLWVLESIDNNKFPYLLSIKKGDETLLRLRVQDRWPGPKGNIFCIKEERDKSYRPVEEIERVPVVSIKRYGKRLAVVLDRSRNKRCDFLFLRKKYKTKEGEYEQIFWRTERALTERHPRVKLTTYYRESLTIVIDANERYPWRFPGHQVMRESLPVGDYAMKDKNGLLAVVERKTLDNMLAEFGRMPAFHQQLSELEAYRHSALVIESSYSDFLNPQKMRFYRPTFAAKAIAELYGLHPGLTIVFTGNRKLAREWTARFFAAVRAHGEDTPHPKVAEVVESYGEAPEAHGGIYYDIRRAIAEDLPPRFTRSMIRDLFADVPESTLTRVLLALKREGLIIPHGRGKKAWWMKVEGGEREEW